MTDRLRWRHGPAILLAGVAVFVGQCGVPLAIWEWFLFGGLSPWSRGFLIATVVILVLAVLAARDSWIYGPGALVLGAAGGALVVLAGGEPWFLGVMVFISAVIAGTGVRRTLRTRPTGDMIDFGIIIATINVCGALWLTQ